MMMSAVHPWLMSLRDNILKAKTVSRPQPYSASASTEWMVDKVPEHKIEEKKSWIRGHGGGPPRPMPASTARSSTGYVRVGTGNLVPIQQRHHSGLP